MKIILFIYCAGVLTIGHASPISQAYGSKIIKRNAGESSFSYSATDIGSKSGTRIKTITVIKNIANKKDKPLKIDPELHKDENWGSIFRDNFDSYGKIPDLPDIFDRKDNPTAETPPEDKKPEEQKEEPKEVIPIYEEPEEVSAEIPKMEPSSTKAPKKDQPEKMSRIIDKLPEDVELIDIGPISLKQAELSAKSQSLRFINGRQNEQQQNQQYMQMTEMIGQNQPAPNPKMPEHKSEPYIFEQPRYTSISDSVNADSKYRQNYKQTYMADESNSKSIYTNNPTVKYNISYSPTTAATPYLAPKKKELQLLKKFSPKQVQGVMVSTAVPYISPSVRKTTSTMVNIEQQTKLSNFGSGDFNPYQVPRFRGLRY